MLNITISTLLLLSFCSPKSFDSFENREIDTDPPFYKVDSVWVHQVLDSLTLDQKIGQLFMVAAYSNKGIEHQKKIEKLIDDYDIGGLIFFQGTPNKQLYLTNHYQFRSRIPLLIAMDAEWGLAMRLDSTIKYPKQMTLGAIQNDSLIYEMAESMATQYHRMGVHVSFSPVLDVNNNPNNPVINYRSFGENRENVAIKGQMYFKGLQDNKILACGKHFPGHGDTDKDSHKTLPVVKHNRERLDSVELYPFKFGIDSGLGSIMVAHLSVPALDSTVNKATTLSRYVVDSLLKQKLKFKGLVFTDALNMKGVSKFYKPGQVDAKALIAGNDVLLFSEDVPKAVEQIKTAIDSGYISTQDIDERCMKILLAKQWCGLDSLDTLSYLNLASDLHPENAVALNKELYEKALTLLVNQNQTLPVQDIANKRIVSLSVGDQDGNNVFHSSMERYANVRKIGLRRDFRNSDWQKIKKEVVGNDVVIVSFMNMNQNPRSNFGLSWRSGEMVKELIESDCKVIVSLFGNPYALGKMDIFNQVDALIVGYEGNSYVQDAAGQLIFGGIIAQGKLPVSCGKFAVGTGITVGESIRLNYTTPRSVGIDPADLVEVEQIVNHGIENGAFPGCQVFAAKDGKVFYHRAFGNHTYDSLSAKVKLSDLYDLASITKIVATTAGVMKLQDEENLSVDLALCDYAPQLVDNSDYINVGLQEMLAHQAGLIPWIPFYLRTMHHGLPRYDVYSVSKSDKYSVPVTDKLFTNPAYKDSIFKWIVSKPLDKVGEYQYSDLGYYFLKEIIEDSAGLPLEDFVRSTFYDPLGLKTIGYLPSKRFPKSSIVPTENDKVFRKQLIHGHVHDQGAAMLGGVGGHAGVFSNANDLGVMMQMFCNYGTYGGQRLLSEEVLQRFTSSPYLDSGNRRGIGFDKPIRVGGGGPTCDLCASPKSFGHSGFTGTLTWADPELGLVYVFLSNRIHPSADNRKIIKFNTRTKIQKVFYDALRKAG